MVIGARYVKDSRVKGIGNIFTFASTGSEMKLRAQFGGKLLNLAMLSTD